MQNILDKNFFNLFSKKKSVDGQKHKPPLRLAKSREWIMDSGATSNCTFVRDWLQNVKRIPQKKVGFGNGGKLSTKMIGSVDTNGMGLMAHNVMYIPGVEANLISVRQLAEMNHTVVFHKDGCEVYVNDGLKIEGSVKARGRIAEDGHYKLVTPTTFATNCLTLWHRRLGHMEIEDLLILQAGAAKGIKFDIRGRIECLQRPCFEYYAGLPKAMLKPKLKRKAYPRATRKIQIVYFYVVGPVPVESVNGNTFFIVFIDDFTRKSYVYFFQGDTELVFTIKMFRRNMELQTGNVLGVMKTHYDRMYLKKSPAKMRKLMMKNGIFYVHTIKRNDVIEYSASIILQKMTCIMFEANLNEKYWADAVKAAVQFMNLTPNKAIGNITPSEAWTGKKPDLSKFRVIGCKAYCHVAKTIVMNLGYEEDKDKYRVNEPVHCGTYCVPSAIFYEDSTYY